MGRIDPRDVRRSSKETAARENDRDGDQRLVDDVRQLLDDDSKDE